MGGLSLQLPSNSINGLQMNLIQKIYKAQKEQQIHDVNLNLLIWALEKVDIITIEQLVEKTGPLIWEQIGKKLKKVNSYFSQMFLATAEFLKNLERHKNTWQYAAIAGHSSQNPLFALTQAENRTLWDKNLTIVQQIIQPNSHPLSLSDNAKTLLQTEEPRILFKINQLITSIKKFTSTARIREDSINMSTLQLKCTGKAKLSQINRLVNREKVDAQIGTPPALNTRRRDRVDWVDKDKFMSAYLVIKNSLLSSKTKENSFQTLNRTLWTNNKAYKSGIRASPNCMYCDRAETMEHMLMDCEPYANKIWETWGKILTKLVRDIKQDTSTTINLTYRNIIFNQEVVEFKKLPKRLINFRKVLQILIHEQRRDIYYRKIQLEQREPTPINDAKIAAHIIGVLKKIKAYLEYLSYSKWKKSVGILDSLIQIAYAEI